MLNIQTLSQLSKLKEDIQAAKEYGEGHVVGSKGRFGFVKLDDGRDAFLSPEKMQRVIPGDIVKVCIVKNAKDQLEAELEKLITPALSRFIGIYRIKGNAHFVEPAGNQASRWIFLPPKSRGKCADGDTVIAKMLHHPYQDGKASAKILERVGTNKDSKYEHKYVKAKYQLEKRCLESIAPQANQIAEAIEAQTLGDRTDLTHISFITIDGESTRDMDDAIAIEAVSDSTNVAYRLHVAIADPSSFIEPDSALAKHSLQNAQTVYLLGGAIPMLPTQLSHHSFSLEEAKQRPAIVCHMDISAEGDVLKSAFELGLIASKHKLTYNGVTRFLEGQEHTIPEAAHAMLETLKDWAIKRRAYREQHYLVSADHEDFDYQIDDHGKIESITARPKSVAQQIVEEAMLATNLAAGKLLAEHKAGLFMTHPGFRQERLGEVKALLKEENVSYAEDLMSLDGHTKLFKDLVADPQLTKLAAPLRRMMDNAELSLTPAPHLVMGLPVYATVTSPIRRYVDLYNHWVLVAILSGNAALPSASESDLEGIKESLQVGRQADRELTQWLLQEFTQKHVGTQARGKIRIVTQQGFGVRLEDNGIEGFVLFPKKTEKKYDAKRMTIEVNGTVYHLDKSVEVVIKSTDKQKRRVAFELAAAENSL